jgi:2-methylisocitrate lyase-like PEP mutase family enzyme/drug/metabolite transporter (DMT)-like permease
MGAIYVTAASLMFALAGAAAKIGAMGLANETIVFWRSVISLALVLPWALWDFPERIRSRNLRFHILRSLASTGSLYCFYYAVAVLPVAEGILLNFTAPLFVPFLGFLIFRFPVSGRVILAVMIGFVGVALILKLGSGIVQPGALIGLLGGFCGAVATVAIWRMSGQESAMRIIFYFALVGVLFTAGPALAAFEIPSAREWITLAVLGVCSTLAHLFFAHGCTIAPSDRVNTLIYTSIIFAAIIGWIIWGDRIDVLGAIGAIVVVAASIIATRTSSAPAASPAGDARSVPRRRCAQRSNAFALGTCPINALTSANGNGGTMVENERTQIRKALRFSALHERDGAFVIPNPWNAGSARILSALGFEALATTSAGLAFSLGRTDAEGRISRQETLANARSIVEASWLPVSADLENGFGDAPEVVAATIRQAAETGLVGGSIEDATGDPRHPIFEHALAVERVAAGAEAARALGFPFMLTARAENFLYGRPDFEDTVRRLQAFEAAGAEVLYAPGLRDVEQIRALCQAVSKPVNVVVGLQGKSYSVDELAAAGVRRISVGSALARAALAGFLRAAEEIRSMGTFGFAEEALPFRTANGFMRAGAPHPRGRSTEP